MRFLTALTASLLLAVPAAADTPKKPEKAEKAEKVEKVESKSEPAKQTCKRKFVGKGLDRKVVCEFEEEIVITGEAPRPKVIVVAPDGRKVTGRPKQTDPLAGLSRRRTTH